MGVAGGRKGSEFGLAKQLVPGGMLLKAPNTPPEPGLLPGLCGGKLVQRLGYRTLRPTAQVQILPLLLASVTSGKFIYLFINLFNKC